MSSKRPVFKEGQQVREYQIVRYIAQGAYGQIFEAKNIKNPERRLALKALYQNQFKEHKKLLELYQNEVGLLKKLKGHPNICEYIYDFEDMKFKYLIMEFCNGGDLIRQLKQRERFSEGDAIQYLSEILEAFKALHNQDKHIIHRDIKLDNIFLHDGVCKLGDFGFAREVPKGKEMAQTWCGSLLTMAPEVIDGKKGYGIQADIYSLGAILYQMVFGDFPYKCYNDNEAQLLKDIKNRKFNLEKYNVKISDELKDLLNKMMTFDPDERITFEQLYNHQFFNKTNEKRKYIMEDNQQLKLQQINTDQNNPDQMSVIQEEEEKQISMNLKLVGSINVGKTSICNAYVNGTFQETQSTIGVQFFKKVIPINGDQITLNIYDTAGLEKHSNLPSSHFKQSDGYILVFDLSDEDSLDTIDYWIEEIEKHDQNDGTDGTVGMNNILVVGNKSDIMTDISSSQQYKDKKKELSNKNIKVLEVSAKTQDNLGGIFNTIAKQIIPTKKNQSNIQAIQNPNQQKQQQPIKTKRYENPSIKPSQLRAGSSNVREYERKKEQKKKGGCC